MTTGTPFCKFTGTGVDLTAATCEGMTCAGGVPTDVWPEVCARPLPFVAADVVAGGGVPKDVWPEACTGPLPFVADGVVAAGVAAAGLPPFAVASITMCDLLGLPRGRRGVLASGDCALFFRGRPTGLLPVPGSFGVFSFRAIFRRRAFLSGSSPSSEDDEAPCWLSQLALPCCFLLRSKLKSGSSSEQSEWLSNMAFICSLVSFIALDLRGLSDIVS